MTMVNDTATDTSSDVVIDLRDGVGGDTDPPRRRRARLVVRIAAGVVALVVAYVGVTFVQVWSASRTNDAPRAGAIVVLGAAQYNGRPSPVLRARLDHALALYRSGLAPTIVVTGGRQVGDKFTEATTGYNYLRARGVPDAAILKEVKGRNTWESIAAVARFLKPRNVDDVILVSDASHSKRLEGIAAEAGLEGHVSPERMVPRSGRGELRSLTRETVAVGLGRLIGYRRMTNWIG